MPKYSDKEKFEMDKTNPLVRLFYSRKFLLALLALAQTLLFNMVPGFPKDVWQAINVILLILIGTIALEDSALKVGAFWNSGSNEAVKSYLGMTTRNEESE